MPHDAIIIGGSYAGLSAALPLARARRSVLVIDDGMRRNRFASSAHGFLTRDGGDPAEIAAIGRAQLMAYETVDSLTMRVGRVEAREGHFVVHLPQGEPQRARRLVLATGVVDELPDVPGLAERWGRSVFHCPYCHGYELDRGRIGVLATSPLSLHQALMLPDWGPTTFFLNQAFAPDAEQTAALDRRGVAIEAGAVDRIEGERAGIRMRDGRMVPLDGLFTATRVRPASAFAEQLGCELEESPFGTTIRTDAIKATTVPGVFACGDAARAAGSVPLAVGDGTLAGVATHRSLMFDEF